MATSRRLSAAMANRLAPGRFAASAITTRLVIGLAMTVSGMLWILFSSTSLSWFGLSPIGLYRSIDQPPILLTLVGVWYSARGVIRGATDEPPDERMPEHGEESEGAEEGGRA